MNGAREWWIRLSTEVNPSNRNHYALDAEQANSYWKYGESSKAEYLADLIHVIEKSAYDAVVKESALRLKQFEEYVERANDDLEAVKIACETLKRERDELNKNFVECCASKAQARMNWNEMLNKAYVERDALAAQLAEAQVDRDRVLLDRSQLIDRLNKLEQSEAYSRAIEPALNKRIHELEAQLVGFSSIKNVEEAQRQRIERLEAQLAEANGLLPGKLLGAQALADEKCRCFLVRIERLERALAYAKEQIIAVYDGEDCNSEPMIAEIEQFMKGEK